MFIIIQLGKLITARCTVIRASDATLIFRSLCTTFNRRLSHGRVCSAISHHSSHNLFGGEVTVQSHNIILKKKKTISSKIEIKKKTLFEIRHVLYQIASAMGIRSIGYAFNQCLFQIFYPGGIVHLKGVY